MSSDIYMAEISNQACYYLFSGGLFIISGNEFYCSLESVPLRSSDVLTLLFMSGCAIVWICRGFSRAFQWLGTGGVPIERCSAECGGQSGYRSVGCGVWWIVWVLERGVECDGPFGYHGAWGMEYRVWWTVDRVGVLECVEWGVVDCVATGVCGVKCGWGEPCE